MTTTIYVGSKGPVEIATMNGKHAATAAAKLRRTEPSRIAEIEALEAHAAAMAAEHEAKAENPRAVIGGNQPPEEIEAPALTGRAAIDAHVADLIAEATNWADGSAIENEGQADSVSRLKRMLQQAIKLVDDAAAEEKRPHNEAIAEIGTWQNGYTAKGLKKTPDGSLTKTVAICSRLETAWLLKLDEERKQREAAAAAKAAKAAAEALAAREEAKVTTDITVVESAEDKLAEAKALLKQAEGVAKERVMVGGGDGFRASSLRSFWHATPPCEDEQAMTDADRAAWTASLKHYMQNSEFRVELRQLIKRWASRDASTEAGRLRGIPGFTITEDKRAA